MSELSKQALKVDNNTSFPNNNTNYITPSILRAFNTNVIDSLVTEGTYQPFTQSVDASIAALSANTASQQISINALNAATASINATIATQQISINALNTTTASLNTSASLALVTASFNNGTRNLTFTKGDASTFAVNIPDASGSILPSGVISGSQQITDLGFVSSSVTASSIVTASVNLNTITFTKGDASTFALTVDTGSGGGGGTIDTGSFATTGSNVFIGDETFQDASGNASTLSPYSGSIVLVAKGLTSGSAGLSNISASTSTQVNLMLKTFANQTGSLTISGSGNMMVMPGAAQPGFRRYATSNNVLFATPQITGSAAYSPNVSNNYLNGLITFRGAVSSSTWGISNNIVNGALNIGSADATPANQAIAGGFFTNNIIFAGLNYNAFTTPLSASANLQTNLVIGATTLNAASSSIQSNNNIFNGNTFTVNNRYFGTASTAAAQRLALSFNVFGGINSSALTTSGSNTTAGNAREVIGNTTNGSGIALGAVLNGDNSHLYSTLVHGSNLTVTGSSLFNTYQNAGGAFIGRNNSVNGTAANSGETVFAVGTGTGTAEANRKTGFLIDSSSNTFIEGPTINVSGSFSNTRTVPGFNAVSNIFSYGGFTGSNSVVYPTANIDIINFPGSGLNNAFQIAYASNDYNYFSALKVGENNFGYYLGDGNYDYDYNKIEFIDNGNQTATANIKADFVNISGSLLVNGAPIGAVNTGSFATTGSNAFNGNQTITGSLTTSERIQAQGINIYSGSSQGIYIGDRTNFNPATTGVPSEFSHTVIGQGALQSFVLGDRNTVVGRAALKAMTTGSDNLAFGAFAGEGLVSGSSNFFVGTGAGSNLQNGSNNFFLGNAAGNQFRSGSGNIILGPAIGTQFVSGSGNLIIGAYGTKIVDNVDNQFSLTYGKSGGLTNLFYKSGSESENLYLYGGLEIQNTLTASLQQGYVWVGDASGRTTTVATSSFDGGGTIPTGTVSSSAQILGYNIFATTGSNTFTGPQIIRSGGGLELAPNVGGGGTDNYINIKSENQQTMQLQNFVVSSGYTSGSLLQLSAGTGSNGFGFSGSATFQMDAVYNGNTAKLQVQSINGVGTAVLGYAERIEFAKAGGFPNTPADSFTVDANTITLNGSTSLSGSLTIQSGSSFFANGNKQFNVGAFSSLVTQSGSAGVSQSVNFDTTDKSEGVSIASNSQITLANSGTYSITFSAQILADGGQDTLWMWLKKNGMNVANTSTKIIGKNGEETVLTVNYVVDAAASDYYELVWENLNGYAELLYEGASGNYPAIPSVILTVTQVR